MRRPIGVRTASTMSASRAHRRGHRLVAREPGRALLEEGVHPLALIRRGEREREPVDLAGEGSGERLRRGPDCRGAWPTRQPSPAARRWSRPARPPRRAGRPWGGRASRGRRAEPPRSSPTGRVRISSFAKPIDVARASRCVPPHPGMTPRVTSGCPNRAVSAATRTSHARAISQPPPRAKPLTAATTGVPRPSIRFATRWPRSANARASRAVGRAHVADVGPGAERLLAGTGEHHRAERRVGVHLAQHALQVVEHLGRERVERLRPVEGEDRDGVAALEVDGHRHSPGSGAGDGVERKGRDRLTGRNDR